MSAEVALYQPQDNLPALPDRIGVPGTQDFDSWVRVVAQVVKLADHIYNTPFVPDGLRGSAPAVAAAMLAGREMGLGPMTSLANIDVIKGRPAPKPVLMRALIQARGHQWVDVDVTDVRAVVRGCRKGETEWTQVTFTAVQAKVAGIDLGKYPADKLYARASSRLAKRKFADVIMGMPYSADDIEDGEDENGAIAVTAAEPAAAIEPAKPRTAQRRTRQAAEPQNGSQNEKPVNPTPPATPASGARNAGQTSSAPADDQPPFPDDEPAPPPGTGNGEDRHRKLTGAVHQHFKRLGYADTDREARLIACEVIAQTGPLESSSDLAIEALSLIADTLARCKTRAQLNALLTAGDKPAESRGGDDGAEAADRAPQAGDGDA